MDIMSLFVPLIFFGVLLYLVTLIPMDGTVKQIIIVLAILFIVLWLIQGLGFYHFGYIGPHR